MYHHLRGVLSHATPTSAVVETGGVGYELMVSLTTHRALAGVGSEVCLLTHLSVREDAHVLYGFLTESERDMFRALIGVSGIGPTTAIQILSAVTATELAAAIAREDLAAMKKFKGVGPKTAQRIILELKGRAFLGQYPAETSGSPQTGDAAGASAASGLASVAARALESLGVPAREAAVRVEKVLAANPDISLEDCIRTALQ